MSEYQLQIKQIVDYPRCRIYRQFIRTLMEDQSFRASEGSGLFHYAVLCSFANFRTSYRHIDGISYTIYPGEWICTTKELATWFHTRFQYQAVNILEKLQSLHLLSFLQLNRGKVIKYKIRDWKKHNTVLDYNCPCQKDTGFFFMPVSTAMELLSTSRCSERDIVLDLWISTVYNDEQVEGSAVGPVVYIRNGTGNPLVAYSELSARWGISKATVGRVLKRLSDLEYLTLLTFPGRHGNVIYLQSYLSTMFQISDVMIDKEEVAMILNIKLNLPDDTESGDNQPVPEYNVCVSNELSSVSKAHIEVILRHMAKVLSAQGIPCFECPKSQYKLYPLSDACREESLLRARGISESRIGLAVLCGDGKPVCTFELTLSPIVEMEPRRK